MLQKERPMPENTQYVTARPEELEPFARDLFVALGTPHANAAEVARHLVHSNLAGHDSHGVMRIPQYVEMIRQKVVNPAGNPHVHSEMGATVVVDGECTFGQVTAAYALEVATSRLKGLGVVVVAMRNANHLGRIGDYVHTAGRNGHVAIVTVGAAGPGVGGASPFGGAGAFLSTNPWAIGIPSSAPDRGTEEQTHENLPGDGDPVLVDFATTVIPEGKVRVARDSSKPVPEGCILDANGLPTTRAQDFYDGGVLLPLGGAVAGHKGYGLAFASALLGALGSIGQAEPNLVGALPPAGGFDGCAAGALLILIDPGAFGDPDTYREIVTRVSRAARRVRPAPGTEAVLIPGDPESRSAKSRNVNGISLPRTTWESLAEIAGATGVAMPHATGKVG